MDCFNENKAVAHLAQMLAARYGFPPVMVRQIHIAALLHDIGKLKIPHEILLKPGKLDGREFEVMKTHTTLGAEMLKGAHGELSEIIKNTCRWHHEWHSGGGYWGIKASELPAYIPIISICDVYCALIHKRSYKKAWCTDDALGYIQNQAGAQFSHELVNDFLSLIQGGASEVN